MAAHDVLLSKPGAGGGHANMRAVYNMKTGTVTLYDDEAGGDGKVFLPEEKLAVRHIKTWQDKISKILHLKNRYVRIFLAELLGTLVLVVFGVGSIAQAVMNGKNLRHNFIGIALGWGLGVAFGLYVSGGVSGGHINPAITILFAVLGRIKAALAPIYIFAQLIGAFLGALIVYLAYLNELDKYDGGSRQGPYMGTTNASTAQIFATYPREEHIGTWQGFLDQVIGTGLLALCALAIIDGRNMQVPKGLQPLLIGLAVATIIVSFESNVGAALNPARDLGPRFFTWIAGWGSGVWSYRDYNWFWVPIFGPIVGALLGGWLYNFCVGLHMPLYHSAATA